ncbi:hypothetical protein BCV69DRAFT_86321 [Microstroma glucosiphilum]|uniref:DUF7924 domain-containing protein n=1 Tax=Pseudomicrostroma glucosiphilum TaxID=1684307 RepID=A0A316TYA5_9BASI|nr:hypothetical protein BCV69DRAFT_86321 [Pseudomicrostroma glucosiphilum]PWN18147.1 hypothetical protein BCV69DRAFT_86321 [Pseudomicrostroma glucosiphilum]
MSALGSNSGRSGSRPASGAYSDGLSRSPSDVDSLGSRSSSRSSEDIRPVTYRTYALSSAMIFINELDREDCPLRIRTFVDGLLSPTTVSTLGNDPSPSLAPLDAVSTNTSLRSTAAALANEGKQCRLKEKAEWMDFARRVFSVFNRPLLYSCQSRNFDVRVSLGSGSHLHLSAPKPDLTFGLAIPQIHAPSLSLVPLVELNDFYGLQPFSSPARPDIAFPFLIFEAKTDCGNMVAAENQAAHGAVKALAMMKTLDDIHRRVGGAQASPRLPVVVICSVGSLYEVFVAFDLSTEEFPTSMSPTAALTLRPGIHLVEIWAGKVDYAETMLQLQLLLHRLLGWVLERWQPAIVGILNTVRAATAAKAPETAQA